MINHLINFSLYLYQLRMSRLCIFQLISRSLWFTEAAFGGNFQVVSAPAVGRKQRVLVFGC